MIEKLGSYLKNKPAASALAVGVLVTMGIYLIAGQSAVFDELEKVALNQFISWRNVTADRPHEQIAICEIDDERSLGTYGAWPWDVDVVLDLVDRLRHQGAEVIALAEPYFMEGKGDADRRAEDPGETHIILGFLFGASPIDSGTSEDSEDDEALNLLESSQILSLDPAADYQVIELQQPWPIHGVLAKKAESLGFLNVPAGGFTEEASVVLFQTLTDNRDRKRYYPSLSLRAVQMARRPEGNLSLMSHSLMGNVPRLAVGSRNVPIDVDGKLWINYLLSAEPFSRLSAYDVLEGNTTLSHQSIVFVGRTQRDEHMTRFLGRLSPIEIYAHVAANLWDDDLVGFKSPWGLLFSWFSILLMAPLITYFVVRFDAAKGAVFGLMLLMSWGLISCGVFYAYGLYLMVVWPILAGLIALGLIVPLKVWFNVPEENGEADRNKSGDPKPAKRRREAPEDEKCRIVFFAANPLDAHHLRLGEEYRAIESKIRAAEHRDTLELISKWAVRPNDLQDALNRHRPHIVHFSGHGSKSAGIVTVDPSGKAKPVSPKALVKLFKTLKDDIRLVVLNACYSRTQADAIVKVIDCAVGMKDVIGDEAATVFAAAFYSALGFDRSIQEAFDQGTAALDLESIPESGIPELLVREGLDPSRIHLLHKSG